MTRKKLENQWTVISEATEGERKIFLKNFEQKKKILKIFFENFFEKKNFSKRQKRSKMLGNDAKIHMLVVSEWKKRGKVVKKENSWVFSRLWTALMSMKEREIRLDP
jgi:hypothetical protein